MTFVMSLSISLIVINQWAHNYFLLCTCDMITFQFVAIKEMTHHKCLALIITKNVNRCTITKTKITRNFQTKWSHRNYENNQINKYDDKCHQRNMNFESLTVKLFEHETCEKSYKVILLWIVSKIFPATKQITVKLMRI